MHLHPEWQIIIRNMLDKVFPRLQLVITTHSKHLIASAHEGESKSYSGWSTDEILEDVMEVKNLENKEYNLILKKTMDSILAKDVDNIKICIEQLEKIVHPNNTIVNEMKIKLAELILEDE